MTLRVLHTSDWHLGRALHEEPLLEDQAWVLDRLVMLAREERPDVMVVAGDVYDRAVPPAEAVALLDDVLTRLADLGVPVVVIAGNHDSGERLSFGARLLAARGVHLRGALANAHEPDGQDTARAVGTSSERGLPWSPSTSDQSSQRVGAGMLRLAMPHPVLGESTASGDGVDCLA